MLRSGRRMLVGSGSAAGGGREEAIDMGIGDVLDGLKRAVQTIHELKNLEVYEQLVDLRAKLLDFREQHLRLEEVSRR